MDKPADALIKAGELLNAHPEIPVSTVQIDMQTSTLSIHTDGLLPSSQYYVARRIIRAIGGYWANIRVDDDHPDGAAILYSYHQLGFDLIRIFIDGNLTADRIDPSVVEVKTA